MEFEQESCNFSFLHNDSFQEKQLSWGSKVENQAQVYLLLLYFAEGAVPGCHLENTLSPLENCSIPTVLVSIVNRKSLSR